MLKQLLIAPIRFYQRYLSPLKRTPSCRYLPTCSSYAMEAIERRGVLLGSAKAVWRILRCNPLFRGGYDPVDPPHTCGRDARDVGLDDAARSSENSVGMAAENRAHDTPTTVRV